MKTKILLIFFTCVSFVIHAQSNPYEKWSFPTGGKVLSHPVVDGDVVYFGSDDRSLYAVDILSGKMQWRYTTRFGIRSKALIHNGIVFVISGFYTSADTTVKRLSAE